VSSVPAPSARSTSLALCEVPGDPGIAAPWIGSLLALGARASRFARGLSGRQLVIAITLRDLAHGSEASTAWPASTAGTSEVSNAIIRRVIAGGGR